MSTVFLIPGAGQDAATYTNLISMLKRRGHDSVPIAVDWSKGSFKQWIAEADRQIEATRVKTDYDLSLTLGFSYGGLVSLFTDKCIGDTTLCCSSPDFFDESMRSRLDAVTSKYARFKTDWHELRSLALEEKWNTFTDFAYGANESEFYKASADRLAQKVRALEFHVDNVLTGKVTHAPRAETVIIPNAGHDINSPEYVSGLEKSFFI